jgi:D-alanine transaminase
MGINYVNGQYVSSLFAMVPMEDRGYQFADGVYEVIAYFNRQLLDEEPHLLRLERSLRELRISAPMEMRALSAIMREVIRRNRYEHGGIYLQITRGTAKRDHVFPKQATPSVTMSCFGQKTPSKALMAEGCKVITHLDQRWKRCDIKTIALLPNVLAKQKATEAGVREALLVTENETVTEGSVSNAFIVKNGAVITQPATNSILGGIAREVALELARQRQIPVRERSYTLQEVREADEAFLTGTTTNVLPITQIDGQPVGNGKPGPITLRLWEAYAEHVKKQTGYDLAAA